VNISRFFIISIATWFGCGFMPFAPGTFASIATVPLLFLLKDVSLSGRIAILLFFIILGTLVSHYAQHIFRGEDPSEIVIDEVVGMLFSCLFVPFNWKYILILFILFRLLDITKPFPIGQAEKLKGGLGIMLDDIIAGAISYALMLIFFIIFWHGDLKKFYSLFS